MSIKCKLGLHDWAKCVHPRGLYLYGQKFCTKCRKQAPGFAEKEIDKDESLVANKLVFYKESIF